MHRAGQALLKVQQVLRLVVIGHVRGQVQVWSILQGRECSEGQAPVTVTGTASGNATPPKQWDCPLKVPSQCPSQRKLSSFTKGYPVGLCFLEGYQGFVPVLAELSSFIPINLPCSCLVPPPNSEELSNRNKSHCWISKDLRVFPIIIRVTFSAEGPPWTKWWDLSHPGLPLLHIPTLPELGEQIKHSPGPSQSG